MKAFDWQRMALDKVPVEFLAEVALRSLYTFVLVFIFLKITGRRGVRQMSLFEVLIILTLGSAAGDVAFYDDVPLLPVLVVFITLALLYRGIMWLMGHSEKLEDLLEGKPIVVVEEGQLAWEKLHAENMTNSNSLWSCGSTASSSLARSGWRSLKPTGRSACFIIRMKRSERGCLSCLPTVLRVTPRFRRRGSMPAYAAAS
ncbi:inner membrane protein [Klebsiella variicola]|nr:inner membrane protein [Klebsiella variicola]